MSRKLRLDLYHECNVEGASVDDFTAQCCMHCINPECSRSSFGQSKFDIRVSTWEERLFTDVPRMDPADLRYSGISSQKFLAVNPPLGSVRSNWVDPRDLERAQAQPAPEPAPVPKAVPQPTPDPAPEPEAEAGTTPKEDPKPEVKDTPVDPPAPSRLSPGLAYTNTQAPQGQMIPQRNQEPTAPKSDWSAPVPTTDTEGVKVVKPGEKIKIG